MSVRSRSSRRVLITGQTGRVSRALQRQTWPDSLDPIYAGRTQLDLLQTTDLKDQLAKIGPAVVINTAAFTDVDGAESQVEAAYILNQDVPGRLAAACYDLGLDFIHLSTDYVFGEGVAPHSEADLAAPLGVYGASKRAGEIEVFRHHPRAQVVRTSWLFDGLSSNFLTVLLGLRERAQLDVIADQYGSPTLTDHLAQALIELALNTDQALPRLLHFANLGGASRFEMAQTLFAKLNDEGPRPVLQPVPASQWPAAAKRPVDSRLSIEAWVRAGLTPPATWQVAVEEGVEQWRSRGGPDH